jgi:hypothetical protein
MVTDFAVGLTSRGGVELERVPVSGAGGRDPDKSGQAARAPSLAPLPSPVAT